MIRVVEAGKMCKNLTEIVDWFLSFLSWLCGMNLVTVLPWIEVSFECCNGIRISYMDKTSWCVYGEIDVRDVGTCLDKRGGRK